MKVIKPFNLGVIHRLFEAENRFYFSVAALACFSFADSDCPLPEPEMWKFAAREMGKDAMLDAGMPKARGEVLIHGKCFAPGGKPARANQAGFRVGPLRKGLYVFGDRYWMTEGGLFKTISDPEPFTEMPLSWANAFGGEGFAKNPLGKGFKPVTTPDGLKIHLLPNLEDPEHLIGSPDDEPEPAGFSPLDLTWPQRAKKAGTYDEKWRRELFPGLARDIDPAFFNEAPADQWLPGFFQGGETFELQGMNPHRSVVSGRLPSLRARVFINQKADEKDGFHEIPARIDTVWLFPEAELGVIISRGVIEVTDDEAADVTHLVMGYERLGDPPRSAGHYQKALERRLDPREELLALLDDSDLIPPGEKPPLIKLLEEEEEEESPLKANLRKKAEKELEKNRGKIAFLGMDPDKVLPAKLPAEDNLDPAAFVDQVKEMVGKAQEMKAAAGEKKEQLLATARDVAEKAGLDFEALLEKAKKSGPKRPGLDPDQTLKMLKSLGEVPPGIEEKLAQAQAAIAGAYHKHAQHFPEPVLREEDDPAQLRRVVIERAKAGKSFKGHDLIGADLSKLDLRGIDFSGAFLEKADLSGANLAGANLAGAVVTWSNLEKAVLQGANLAGANFGACNLKGADFSSCDMTGAVLSKSDLEGAKLAEAKLKGVDLLEANLKGADFTRAVIGKANFLKMDLSGAKFSGAVLSESNWLEINAAGADFTGADLKGSVLVEFNADKAGFAGANLSKVTAVSHTSFKGANLKGAVIRNAGLLAADLEGANLSGADLSSSSLMECNLSKAVLDRAVAPRARFDKADLTGASLKGLEFSEGSFRKAKLMDADLSGANLYGAEVFRVKIGRTNFEGANLDMTKLEKWRP